MGITTDTIIRRPLLQAYPAFFMLDQWKGSTFVSEYLKEELQEEDTMRGRYITFAVGSETYGIEIRYATEIIGIQPINSLPEVPEHIKGVINLRGKIIPVVDMRLKFKIESVPYDDRTCIIVIDKEEISAGLIVDEVAEVLTIDDIAPSPYLGTETNCRYLAGIGKVGNEVKLLLDCRALFDREETHILGDSARTTE
jgi:purine-binding chemotaxis protein CheW